MASVYIQVAALILNQQPCVALTGAGISAATRVTFDALGGLAENALCDIKEVI
jgi:hypothetical protein